MSERGPPVLPTPGNQPRHRDVAARSGWRNYLGAQSLMNSRPEAPAPRSPTAAPHNPGIYPDSHQRRLLCVSAACLAARAGAFGRFGERSPAGSFRIPAAMCGVTLGSTPFRAASPAPFTRPRTLGPTASGPLTRTAEGLRLHCSGHRWPRPATIPTTPTCRCRTIAPRSGPIPRACGRASPWAIPSIPVEPESTVRATAVPRNARTSLLGPPVGGFPMSPGAARCGFNTRSRVVLARARPPVRLRKLYGA